MAEELLTAEVLEIGILQPAFAELLVREVEGVLEDGQAGHEACGQGWASGLVVVDGSEVGLEDGPADLMSEPDEGVFEVEDLIEPGAKEIGLSAVAPFFGSHGHPAWTLPRGWNHGRRR